MLADTFTDWVAANDPGALGAVVLGLVAWVWFRRTRGYRGHWVPLRWRLLAGAVALVALFSLGQRLTDIEVVDNPGHSEPAP